MNFNNIIITLVSYNRLQDFFIWCDTANTVNRMESHGEGGKIHCSEEVYEALKDQFVFEERGEIEIKGKVLCGLGFGG